MGREKCRGPLSPSPLLSGDDEALNTLKVARKFDTRKRRKGEARSDFCTARKKNEATVSVIVNGSR